MSEIEEAGLDRDGYLGYGESRFNSFVEELMRNFLKLAVWAVILALSLSACSVKPDPAKNFGAYLNGRELQLPLGDPIGCIQELEAGFSLSYTYSIIFPLKLPVVSPLPRPGIILYFNQDNIRLKEETPLLGEGVGEGPWLEYHPLQGHKMNEAVMLVYSSRRAGGGGSVRFDMLEPEPGGRVSGSIIRAVLYGYYENMETSEVTELPEPKKLELFNWSFDGVLKRTTF